MTYQSETKFSEKHPMEDVSRQSEALKTHIWLKRRQSFILGHVMQPVDIWSFSDYLFHFGGFPELYCFNLHIEPSPTHFHLNIRLQMCSHLIKTKEYILCLTLKPTGLLVWALLTWAKIAGSDLHSSVSLVKITHISNAGNIFPYLIHIHVSWILFFDLRIKVIVLSEIPV